MSALICIHIYTHTCIDTCKCIHMHAHIDIQVYIEVCTFRQGYYIFTHYTLLRTHIFYIVCVYIYICMYTHIYI